jgi:hypothetical protein
VRLPDRFTVLVILAACVIVAAAAAIVGFMFSHPALFQPKP